MQTWDMGHGKDGTEIILHEVPLWAHLVQEASEWFLEATHPTFCCSDWPWAWKIAWAPPPPTEQPDEDGWVYNPNTLGHALHMVGQRLANGAGAIRKYRMVARIPVTPEWVREHCPDAGWPFDGTSEDAMRAGPADDGDVQL